MIDIELCEMAIEGSIGINPTVYISCLGLSLKRWAKLIPVGHPIRAPKSYIVTAKIENAQ